MHPASACSTSRSTPATGAASSGADVPHWFTYADAAPPAGLAADVRRTLRFRYSYAAELRRPALCPRRRPDGPRRRPLRRPPPPRRAAAHQGSDRGARGAVARARVRHAGRRHDPPPGGVRRQPATPRTGRTTSRTSATSRTRRRPRAGASGRHRRVRPTAAGRGRPGGASLEVHLTPSSIGYRRAHPDWIFVRHEDLSASPVAGFESMCSRLGLESLAGVEAVRGRR